jgi:hypothetical protein
MYVQLRKCTNTCFTRNGDMAVFSLQSYDATSQFETMSSICTSFSPCICGYTVLRNK